MPLNGLIRDGLNSSIVLRSAPLLQNQNERHIFK